jgi:RHS repeat-associated protein
LNPSGGIGLEGQAAYNAFNNHFGSGSLIDPGDIEDEEPPRAFINYLLFDENFALVDAGFDQVTTNAEQVGVSPNVLHDYLSLHVKIKQKGYLYVYVSNEHPVLANVYFDDLKIVHHTGVEQSDDYYAFGLTFNSYQRENTTKNNYTYNGKELQDELDLGWLDYGARMYMPEIGRWGLVDRLADHSYHNTPYRYSFNNPINYFDPDGNYELSVTLSKEEKKAIRSEYKGKERREKMAEKKQEKKDEFNVMMASVREMLSDNPNLGGDMGIGDSFESVSGFDLNKDGDDLFTENGKGPKIALNGNLKSAGVTQGQQVDIASNMDEFETMVTVLHEYVHVGGNKGLIKGDFTQGGYNYSNIFKDFAYQASSLQDARSQYIQDSDPRIQANNARLFDRSYRGINVEGGYLFEKMSFGQPLLSPAANEKGRRAYLDYKSPPVPK